MDDKSAELYEERLKRVQDAVQLKVPDRVPVVMEPALFPAKYAGITCEEFFNDPGKWCMALQKTIQDFEPDMFLLAGFMPGPVLEALDCKQLRWPGHGVPSNHSHQFVEGEYMTADEYDAFLEDMSDFAIRTYLPRIFGTLEAFKMLPPLWSMSNGYSAAASAEVLTTPELSQAFESLFKAGQEMSKWRSETASFPAEIAALGYPSYSMARTQVPFDRISDFLRGMKGTMLDMYRQPDKLLKASEKALSRIVQQGVSAAKSSGNTSGIFFLALHRGAHGFMSLEQFETFYWPDLKKIIVALVDEGLTPSVFLEGNFTSRLEYLLELPKGKIIAHFDTTDMFRAKEILRDHICIQGNVPSSLLQTGTPQDVKDYCKKLIDVVGKGGGFIISPRSSLDEVKPENLKAMVDFTKEYGKYN